jgi:thiosulfate/3-mercaptopyruvate sulfurtransferase
MPISQYAHPEVLVDTQWVADHLNDPNVRLVEVDMSPQTYNAGHIPGAVFWNGFTDLLLPEQRINLDTTALEKLLARSGIANDTTVVTYGSHPAAGGWLFWFLKVFGHRDVRVLNGSRQKWMAQGRPLTTEPTIVTPTDYHTQALDSSLRALREYVYESIDRADRVLVDVRTPQEYRGEWFMVQPPKGRERAGHIPRAVHVGYELAHNDDGTFKPVDALQSLYTGKGITPDQEVITYCAVGARSGHIWFVLKYLLGYPNVRNYDGSWNEWSQLPDMAIALC